MYGFIKFGGAGRHLLMLVVLAGLCCGLSAQEIKRNEVDPFTQERTIETSVVSLKSAYTKGIGIYFSAVGDHLLVNIAGYGNGIGPIRKGDFVYFLLEDRMILTALSIGEQPEHEEGSGRIFQHHYLMRLKDFEDLVKKDVALIRLTTEAGNLDITMSKKNTKEIKKTAGIFVAEVKNNRQSR